MWFNQALIFSYEQPKDITLNDALQELALHACPPHARFTYGWLPVIHDLYTHEVQGVSLIKLGKEERILPKGVIKKLLEEKIEALEAQKGRSLSRAEKAKMGEDLEFELLPKAFCLQKNWSALIDTTRSRLIINSSSASQAAQLTSLLRKAIPGVSITPVETEQALSPLLTQWLYEPHTLPVGFTIAENCILFDTQDEKKKMTCKGYDLNAQEIKTLISEGLAVQELSLVWQDRISFTLTHELIIKRMKCMDYLVDEFQNISSLEEELAQKDASLALMAGEIRALIDYLIEEINKPRSINIPAGVEAHQKYNVNAPLPIPLPQAGEGALVEPLAHPRKKTILKSPLPLAGVGASVEPLPTRERNHP